MCGITGIYQFEGNKNYKNLITLMTKKLSHRGPDQNGVYIDSSNKVFLGHRRLSILDLSEKGHQPMTSSDKKVIISFNGEIYNFKEIRTNLEKKHQFNSETDTEVLIYAYKEWGINFIKKLNGMFSFIIYDKENDTLYVVRDRIGIKPLYYSIFDDKIVFSSEVKSIFLCDDYNKELDLMAVSSYLSYRYPLGDKTFFKGIKSLSPGCYLKISGRNVEKIKYWDLKVKTKIKDLGEGYYKSKIKSIFTNSVEKRMISDVPLGAYLSGGLDSSAIVALMAKNSNKPVKTFTIGFKEEGYNEFNYASLVAKMHNTDHKEILLSAEEYLDSMKKLISFKDAPLGVPNEVPLYLMSKELKKHITVVLSGEGADEIFSGYGRLFRSPFDYYKMKVIRKIPFSKYLPFIKSSQKNLIKKYGGLKFNNQLGHFLSQYTYFPFKEKWSIFSNEMLTKIEKDNFIFKHFREEFYKNKVSYYRKISYVFEKMHLPGLLQRVDNCTMATSVEARVPFVDHKLVEFMMNVPVKYKMKWKSSKDFFKSLTLNSSQISENKDVTKYLLREIIRDDLPLEILSRKKQGFPVPLNVWFKEDFVELAKNELLSGNSKIRTIFDQEKLKKWINSANSENFGQKLWMILNLEYFLREYF